MNEHEQHGAGDEQVVAATEVAEEQGLLFTDDVSPLPSDLGYRGPTACNAAGITYRQLDYWARTGLVEPTVRSATGSDLAEGSGAGWSGPSARRGRCAPSPWASQPRCTPWARGIGQR